MRWRQTRRKRPMRKPQPMQQISPRPKRIKPPSQREYSQKTARMSFRILSLKPEKETPKEDVATLTKEELDTLEAESPTLAKTLRAQQASIQKLTEQLQAVAERQEDQAV